MAFSTPSELCCPVVLLFWIIMLCRCFAVVSPTRPSHHVLHFVTVHAPLLLSSSFCTLCVTQPGCLFSPVDIADSVPSFTFFIVFQWVLFFSLLLNLSSVSCSCVLIMIFLHHTGYRPHFRACAHRCIHHCSAREDRQPGIGTRI